MRLRHHTRIPAFTAALFSLLGASWALATLPSNAPSLSVHATAYGTALHGTRQESIERLAIRIASHAGRQGSEAASTEFEVECFFLKRGEPGRGKPGRGKPGDGTQDDLPSVHDTVIFEVNRPHGTYLVDAIPIRVAGLSGGAQSGKSKSPGKSAKRSSSQPALPSPSAPPTSPREGYVIRILCKGVLLRQECSSHQIERLLREHPELLEGSSVTKTIRFVEAETLLKRH